MSEGQGKDGLSVFMQHILAPFPSAPTLLTIPSVFRGVDFTKGGALLHVSLSKARTPICIVPHPSCLLWCLVFLYSIKNFLVSSLVFLCSFYMLSPLGYRFYKGRGLSPCCFSKGNMFPEIIMDMDMLSLSVLIMDMWINDRLINVGVPVTWKLNSHSTSSFFLYSSLYWNAQSSFHIVQPQTWIVSDVFLALKLCR